MTGKKSGSYANHFSQLLPSGLVKPSVATLREHLPQRFEVLWQGKPISTVKTFKTDKCALCVNERLEIIKHARGPEANLMINTNDEIFGACRHKPMFHRYHKSTTNAEEPAKGERVCLPCSETSSVAPNSTTTVPSVTSVADGMDPSTTDVTAGPVSGGRPPTRVLATGRA